MTGRVLASVATAALAAFAARPFHDERHYSQVLNEHRNYRVLLPPEYESSPTSRFPVIYYFHGHSDRYTVERYDNGTDTIPKMAEFVRRHPVIVVCVDGYVARDYTGFYGGSPWDVRREGGDYDFGKYFLEVVAHIDSKYRTLTSRRYRATSGLSMGGFMSLWLSARYPDRIGSASSFNPGPEFYAGEKGRRVLWRPKDHTANHEQSMIRLIRASGDYISQYHMETWEAYARALKVDFEFRQDEYHRHWATSISETFAFHWRAFGKPSLDNTPERFSHADPYARFAVWGWEVESEGSRPAITYLDEVAQGGLRVRTRRWAPDGPAAPDRKIVILTPGLYQPGTAYTLLDYSLETGRTSRRTVTADAGGRLRLETDGRGHQLSLSGPGTGAEPPVLLPVTKGDRLIVEPDLDVALPVKIYNPRGAALGEVTAELTSDYPTVRVVGGRARMERLEPGATADLAASLRARFTSGDGYFAPTRLKLKLTYDGWLSVTHDIDVLVAPAVRAAPDAFELLDGRRYKFAVFRQRGNQGGGELIAREVDEGKGNGNGRLEPGEEATIWVKLAQGLDPFDKNSWRRTKVYTDSPWITEIADLSETKQREWTGAQERTSLVRLAENAPAGAIIPLWLASESWSFHWTPDVRYGQEPLYQAFQLHRRHLNRLELRVGGVSRGTSGSAKPGARASRPGPPSGR